MENKNLDLEAFRAEVKQNRKALKKSFRKLKTCRPKVLDQAFQTAHDEVFAEIDCLSCANCCKTTGPLFTQQDIDRLAKHFRMKAGDFMDQYLRTDEDGDWVLKQTPCPFLGSDNYCSVYEVRPKACRTYPHTDRGRMHQILDLTEKNARMCPAVYEMVKRIEFRV